MKALAQEAGERGLSDGEMRGRVVPRASDEALLSEVAADLDDGEGGAAPGRTAGGH